MTRTELGEILGGTICLILLFITAILFLFLE